MTRSVITVEWRAAEFLQRLGGARGGFDGVPIAFAEIFDHQLAKGRLIIDDKNA